MRTCAERRSVGDRAALAGAATGLTDLKWPREVRGETVALARKTD